jgi:hypothetical protein
LKNNGSDISTAAPGDNQKGKYAIHIVNISASKPAFING